MRILLALLVSAILVTPAWARDERSPEDARVRMEHHLKEVNRLAQHFDGVLTGECPKFPSRRDWTAYLDGEIDQVVGIGTAADFDQPHTRLAVSVPAKVGSHSSIK